MKEIPETNMLQNTTVDSKSLIDIFELNSHFHANKVAIFHGDKSISYRELNCQANIIADCLIKSGVDNNSIVGILLERGIDLIASMLGILKTGAAYTIIDLDYPISRIEYILDDINYNFLLTEQSYFEEKKISKLLINHKQRSLYVSLLLKGSKHMGNPILKSNGNTLACIIYTSGSTGKPKGVLLNHTTFFRFFEGPNIIQISNIDCIAQIANASFDAWAYEIWSAFGKGGSLVIIDKNITLSAQALKKCFQKYNVTTAVFTVGLFNQLAKTEPGIFKLLKNVLFVGEAANPEIVRKIINNSEFKPQKLFNGYGPTEGGVFTTYHEVKTLADNSTSVPIGSPVNDTQVYVLDKNLNRVNPGEVGELYIAGDGVAKGYLNLPDLTAERFMLCPFDVNSRMYKTGDLGRMLPDGMLEFVGRKDNQVKIRGHRIELEEIESGLESHPEIWKGIVLAPYTKHGHRQLVTYFVPKSVENKIAPFSIKAHLKEILPDYMIPGVIIQLDSLPLTPHGKVDRQKLSELPINENIEEVSTESLILNEIEKNLIEIWKNILGVNNIQLNDNFFDLGGDSIMIMQMIAQAAEHKLVLSHSLVLQHPTIESLASLAKEQEYIQQEDLIDQASFDLSAIQTWYFGLSFKNPNYFHHVFQSPLKETIDIHCLKKAIENLIEYHDVFQLRFSKNNEKYQQYYSDEKFSYNVDEISIKNLLQTEAEKVIERYKNQLCNSIDIHNGPLVKAAIFTDGGVPKSLMIVIHHLIIDGISWRILIGDLSRIYKGLLEEGSYNLPSNGSSFKTWVTKTREYAFSNNLLQEAKHWLNTINNNFSLPIDHQKGPNIESSNKIIRKSLSLEFTQGVLKTIPHALHVDINDILLTALFQTISKWSNQSEIILELEGHGREDVVLGNFARTVGWFTGLFPVALKNQSKSLKTCLFEIQTQLKNIPVKGVGYGILKFLNENGPLAGSLSSRKNIPIRFNYLGQFDQNSGEDPLFEFVEEPFSSPSDPENERTHLLIIESWVTQGQLQFAWHYSDNYHKAETIEKLALNFNETLRCLIKETQTETIDISLTQYSLQEIKEILPNIKEVQSVYSLLPIQEGLLFHAIHDPKSHAYFIQTYWNCREYDSQIMLAAWNALLANHELFRASYLWEGMDYPVQVIYKEAKITLIEENWSELSIEEQETKLHEYLINDRNVGIDLEKAPLMRLSAIRLSNSEQLIIWSFHHILVDGWSVCRIIEELDHYYSTLNSGKALISKQAPSFGDYIRWYKRHNYGNNKLFWERYLVGFTSANQISLPGPVDSNKATHQTSYCQFDYYVSKRLSDLLHQYAKDNRLTLNTIMQGIWAYLLSIYCNTLDIVFGLTVSTRPSEIRNVNSIVGPLINTLPFRVKINKNISVLEYFNAIQNNLADVVDHSFYSHIEIQRGSQVGSGNNLFNSSFGFESQQIKQLEKNLSAFYNIKINEITHYPLSLYIIPGECLQFKVSYDENLYSKNDVEKLINHYVNLLTNLAQKTNAPLNQLSCLSPQEFQQIINDWNQTEKKYPQEKTMHQMFEEQVDKTPKNIAVIYEDVKLTYRELNEKANQLARYIGKLTDIRPDTLVALCLNRSEKMLISILAILKAGAAYVPMDPSYPDERISYMLEDTKTNLLITNEIYEERLKNFGEKIHVFAIDNALNQEELGKQPFENIVNDTGSENLAHVIYTSGTTGQPKGVMSKHTGAVNRIKWGNDQYLLKESDKILQKTPYVFDVSVWELFWANWFGACIVFAKPEIHKDANAIIDLIRKEAISIIHFVPSMLSVFEETLEENFKHGELKKDSLISLEKIFCSGEALSLGQVKKMHQLLPDVEIHNLYGPTEASIEVLYYDCSDKNITNVYLGKPIDNTTAYVLDENLALLPIGVIGELYIGGVGLARGYLNKPELTAEKFVKNPFQTEKEKKLGKNERLYKTGDLVKWLPDGNLEYLGRNDFQVKIRGFRIELGDIETALSGFKGIKQSVIISKEKEGNKYLAGYYVADKKLDETVLLSYLKKNLPEYMIPSILIYLKEMPLNINGKLDRNQLPEFEFSNDENYVEPTSELEVKLCNIWSEILKLKKIGITDDFFRIGGDSLNAVRLISHIRKEFGIKIPVRSIFDAPTIIELSELLRKNSDIHYLTNNRASCGPSFIIPLQKKGNKRPLFLIHPIGGTVFCYLGLKNYIDDRPIYGIEDPGINASPPNFNSLEELAAYYLKGIKQIQPEGPYLIGGASFGGIIAIEIANQLNANNEVIEFIGLFDSWAIYPNETDQKDWFEKHMQEQHEEMNNQLSEAGLDPKDPWFNLQWNRKELSLKYKVPIIKNKVTLFKAKILLDVLILNSYNSPTNLWEPFFSNLEIINVPGNHYSMFNEQNIEKLGNCIQNCLN